MSSAIQLLEYIWSIDQSRQGNDWLWQHLTIMVIKWKKNEQNGQKIGKNGQKMGKNVQKISKKLAKNR